MLPFKAILRAFLAGVRDALWPWSILYVVTSPMIRGRFFQCFMLNGLIFLGSLMCLNFIIQPIIVFILSYLFGLTDNVTEWIQFTINQIYKGLWVLPLYIFSFVVNSLWYQDIAQQALILFNTSRESEEMQIRATHLKQKNKHLLHRMNFKSPHSRYHRSHFGHHNETIESTYVKYNKYNNHNNHNHNNYNGYNYNNSYNYTQPTLTHNTLSQFNAQFDKNKNRNHTKNDKNSDIGSNINYNNSNNSKYKPDSHKKDNDYNNNNNNNGNIHEKSQSDAILNDNETKSPNKNNSSNNSSNVTSHKRKNKSKRRNKKETNVFHRIHNSMNQEIYHSLFLLVFNIEILIFSKIGFVIAYFVSFLIQWNAVQYAFIYFGYIVSFLFLCWQHSFLSFEYKWIHEGIRLQDRTRFFEERIPYFSGFGAPLTLVVLTAPALVSSGLYALIFPLFIIQAIEAAPVSHRYYLSEKTYRAKLHRKLPQIPIFATTQWLEYCVVWFFGNYFCCIRAVLTVFKYVGRIFGI